MRGLVGGEGERYDGCEEQEVEGAAEPVGALALADGSFSALDL
jgi:hypothetical protein